jgi:hypothetical protein
MDKSNPPTSFGVFKPVGHVVIALDSAPLAQAVADRLLAQGFAGADLVHYTPQEMINQVDAQLLSASPLASVGQDLNLITAHRALAESGCSFLVVKASEADQVAKVRSIANGMNAKSAQRYGVLIVEELMDPQTGERQVFESPDRGLDAEVTPEKAS